MAEFAALFISVLSPVFLIITVGYLARRVSFFDIKSISRLNIYILGPALAFRALTEATITSREIGIITLYTVMLIGILALSSFIILSSLGIRGERLSAFLLSGSFMNCGNYGLPVLLFALGEEALGRGVVFMIVHMFLIYTLGVFLASGERGFAKALRAVLRMPALYAAGAALVFKVGGFNLPEPVFKSVELVSYAAVPVELLILGMQLSAVKLTHIGTLHIGAALYRLLASPVIGVGLVALLGITGLTGKVLILESAFPTAVLASVLATEFDGDAQFVSTTTLLATVLSLFTVGFILTILTG